MNVPFTKYKIDLPEEYRENCIRDIYEYFSVGDWCEMVPKYQTWPVLFERTETHWKYLKDTFLEGTKNKTYKSIHAWAYVSFSGKESSKKDLFHVHSLENSAVFYLKLSTPTKGTIFKTDDYLISPIVDTSSWYYFKSNVLHSPSDWDHLNEKENRIVLAVEYE